MLARGAFILSNLLIFLMLKRVEENLVGAYHAWQRQEVCNINISRKRQLWRLATPLNFERG